MIMKNIICDGVILNIIRSHKFRWSEKGLGCEYLTGWASAEPINPISCQWPLSIPPLKHRKTSGFLIFSRGIEWDQWHEMCYTIR